MTDKKHTSRGKPPKRKAETIAELSKDLREAMSLPIQEVVANTLANLTKGSPAASEAVQDHIIDELRKHYSEELGRNHAGTIAAIGALWKAHKKGTIDLSTESRSNTDKQKIRKILDEYSPEVGAAGRSRSPYN